jgi:hypothetical protein
MEIILEWNGPLIVGQQLPASQTEVNVLGGNGVYLVVPGTLFRYDKKGHCETIQGAHRQISFFAVQCSKIGWDDIRSRRSPFDTSKP